jgi:hypothetical protein
MKTLLLITLLLLCNYTFSQWVQTPATPQGSGITGMVITHAPFYNLVVTTGSVSGGQQGGVRISIDGGQTWDNRVNCFIGRTIAKAPNGYLYASLWYFPTANEGIYCSLNSGADWTPIFNFATTGNNIFSLLPIDTLILAGTRTGILRSTNSGASFAFSNNGIPLNSWVLDIVADSNNVIAAATTNGLFISTNQGDSWYQSTGLPSGDTVTSVSFYRINTDNGFTEKLIAGTDDGKILTSSSNAGYAGLVLSAILGTNVRVETVSRAYISLEELYHFYIATRPKNPQQPGGGVYKSTNEGQTFNIINNGLPQNPVASKIIGDLSDINTVKLKLGLFNNQNNGAQIYTQSFPIGIQQISSEVPGSFMLSQNYPNPFNPNTYIEFAVPKSSFIKLIVYDMLGREVETLVSKELSAGTYKADWNASKYTSGVYFYKLFTEGYTETKKMILVK